MKHYITIILFLLSMLMFVPGFVFADLTLTDVSISPSSPTTTNTLSGTFTGSYTNVSYAWNTDNGSIQFFCSWNAQSDDCGDYYNFTSTGTTNYTINDFYGTYGLTADASSDEWDGVNNAEVFNDDNFAYVFTIKHDIVSTDQQYYKKGHTGAPYENGYGRLDNQGANAYLHFRTQDTVPVSNNLYSTTAIVANTWYHVAFVKCGNTKYIYLDGVEDNAATVMTGIYDADGDFRIFRDNGFDGTMGEFRYYDRCITPTEVLNLYHNNPIFNFTDTSVGMNITLTAKADNGTSFTAWVSDSVTITSAISEPQVSSVTITGNQSTPGAHLDGSIVASDYTELHTWWNTPDGSLVAYYPFSNASAYDITGNGNTGSVTGATYNSTGGHYDFDGSGDYIDTGSDTRSDENWTISLWLRPYQVAVGDDHIFRGGATTFRCMHQSAFGGRYFCTSKTDTYAGETTWDYVYSHAATLGVWRMLTLSAYVHNSTHWNISIYMDGELDAAQYWVRNTANDMTFSYTSTDSFNGSLDNILIYDRYITAEEVTELYRIQSGNHTNSFLNSSATTSIGNYTLYAVASDSSMYSAINSDTITLSESEVETYERYVDATLGSDSNNGTDSSHPWQTISKLNSSTIPDGTKIYFKAGEVWQEGLAITENNILIGRYGAGDAPYLNGSQSWTRGTIHVTGDNITIQNINLGYGGQETLEFDAVIGISLFNITIDHSYDKTIDIDDSFNAWIENVHLIDSGLKNPIAGAQGEGFWFQDSVNITIKGSSTLRHGGVNFNGFNSRNIFLTNLSAIDANPDNNPYDGLPAYYFDNCSDVIITNVYARNTTLGLSFNAENSSGNNGLAWNMTAINVTCYEVGTCLWIGSNMAGPGPYLHDVSVDRVSIFRETYYRGPVNGYGQDVYVEEVDGFSLTNLLLIQQNDSNTKEIVKFFNDSVTDWVWDNNSYNYTAPFKWQFQSSYGSLLSTWQAKGIDVNSASTDVYFYNKTAVILYDNSSACSFHGAGSEVGASECVTAAGGCIASWSNTSWSSWSDNGTCLTDDNQPQVRSLVQYDTNLCPLSVNVTHYGYQNVSCNYCSYSLVSGSWSNVTCGWRQHNDSVWSSCCSVTGLIADCYSSDNQSVQYNYNETAVCAASSTPTAVCSSVQDMFAVTGAFFSVLIIALLGFTAVHLFKKGQINLSYLAVGGALLVGVGAALLFGSAFVGAVCLTL